MIHKRSTPKIAAIIILAFFIISGLVGATVYFIHGDRLLTLLKNAAASDYQGSETAFVPEGDFNKDIKDEKIEYFEVTDLTSPDVTDRFLFKDDYEETTTQSVEDTTTLDEEEEEDHHYNHRDDSLKRYRINMLRNYHMGRPVQGYVPRRRLRPGPRYRQEQNVPKNFLGTRDHDVSSDFRDYDDFYQSSEVETRRDMANSGSFLQVEIDDDEIFKKVTNDEVEDDISEEEEIDSDYEEEDYEEDEEEMEDRAPNVRLVALGPLSGHDFSLKIEEELTASGPEEKLFPPKLRRRIVSRPRPVRPQSNDEEDGWPRRRFHNRRYNSGFNHRRLLPEKVPRRVALRQRLMRDRIANKKLPVPLPDDDFITSDRLVQTQAKAVPVNVLPTIDRRPGRPSFHHMGPMPALASEPSPFRRRTQQVEAQQWTMPESPQKNYPSSFEKILQSDYIKNLVDLSPADVRLIKEMALNITTNGKELNLWEILDSVNATVSTNPSSNLGKLLDKFYDSYLSVNREEFLENTDGDNDIYKKSLSSLIFLSFGIFLLNSVNDVKATTNGGRSYQSVNSHVLKSLFDSNSEILQLINSDDEFSSRKFEKAAGASASVNSYMRLVINLLKIFYLDQNNSDLDCIWQIYCNEINDLASAGGMPATVAKINSVGVKVMLNMLPNEDNPTTKSLLRSIFNWQSMDCKNMFANCGNTTITKSTGKSRK